MKAPYPECDRCLATKWCKRYSGESPKPESPAWCNPKYRMDKALQMAEIPRRYLNANLHHYQKDDENEPILHRLKPFLENILQTVDDGQNFLFHGLHSGTGKTFHATMLLNQYIYKACLTKRMDFEHPLALFVEYPALMDDLRYNEDKEAVRRRMEIVKNVPLLLLDDIGAGNSSDFTREQTFLLVNHRYNNGLSTISSTNLTFQQLMDQLSIRTFSRLQSGSEKVKFAVSKDWRAHRA